jgi:serine/threonine protein kinase
MSKLTAKQLEFLDKHRFLDKHLKAKRDDPPPYVVHQSKEQNKERRKLIDDSFLTPEKKQQLAEVRKQEEAEQKRKGQEAAAGQTTLTKGKELSHGAEGMVSLVDAANGARLVLKESHPGLFEAVDEGDQVQLDGLNKWIKDEAEVYAAVGDHPNIAQCYGLIDGPDGSKQLLLERVEGKTAEDTFEELKNARERGQITYTQYMGTVQHIMRGMLQGLAKMEEMGYNHNDIKGKNVMIDMHTGQVKLIDLGAGTKHGDDTKMMSPEYAAPEKKVGLATEPNTDSFSVGQMLYGIMEGPLTNADGVRIDRALEKAGEGEDPTEPGKYAGETAYVDFLKQMRDPDPKWRLSPSMALQHAFLTQPLLDEEGALEATRQFVSNLVNPPADKKTRTFAAKSDFSPSGWNQTIAAAVQAGAVPEFGGTTVVAEAFADFETQRTEFAKYSPEDNWDEKKVAAKNALTALDELENSLKNLQAHKEYAGNDAMSAYLQQTVAAIPGQRQPFEALLAQGKPQALTSGLHQTWSAAKAKAEQDFRAACVSLIQHLQNNVPDGMVAKTYIKAQLAQLGLNKAPTLSGYCHFKEDFGSALDKFEKACRSGKDKDIQAAREKAQAVALSYFQSVHKVEPFAGGGPDFRGPLLSTLNSIVHALGKMG